MCATVYRQRHLLKATEVTASLAESNGSLLPGLWRDLLHVTCGLTACRLPVHRDQLRAERSVTSMGKLYLFHHINARNQRLRSHALEDRVKMVGRTRLIALSCRLTLSVIIFSRNKASNNCTYQCCDEGICVSFCLSVCLSSVRQLIIENTRPIFTSLSCILPMAVLRSLSGGAAILCVLPVLWITSFAQA